jgi:hypothetical protein
VSKPGRKPVEDERRLHLPATTYLTQGDLERVDAACRRLGVTRAEYLREALLQRLECERNED